ncbi:hypothetical protein X798_07315 [Onchocerca flexuosa]|uniref:Uncharacterized protein n=1 Tax=Onchocerca flexuosa TaxID=387005 RepID=A0A238BJT3_9BILA|nr:hypothetical protein X798_07315 [Onchocerca flexuosa]
MDVLINFNSIRMGKEYPTEQGNVIERIVNLNNMGEAIIVFTNEELKKHKLVTGYGGSSVKITATVTEDLTDIKRNATTQVEQDVEQYDTTGVARGFRSWESDNRKRSIWFPWWGIGGRDAATIFENSGLVVLTDALLFRGPDIARI